MNRVLKEQNKTKSKSKLRSHKLTHHHRQGGKSSPSDIDSCAGSEARRRRAILACLSWPVTHHLAV